MSYLTEKMKQLALDAGFTQAGYVDIQSLHFDPAIRSICEGNGCRGYGASWACPPAVGTLEDCRQRCEQYQHMLLLSRKYDLEDSFDFEGMVEGGRQFKALMDELDGLAREHLEAYMLLSNEGCGRCSKCTYPDAPCRFPDKLHPSIEGYGFNVSRLAAQAGIRYNNGPDTVTYFGALLFREVAYDVSRIMHMEQMMVEARTILDNGGDPTRQITQLAAYYGSTRWFADLEADEKGLLPPDLRRGVLSEDGLYNLLTDCCAW